MEKLILTSIATVMALLMYIVLTFRVGLARMHHKIPAPIMTGAEGFERTLRIQQNTVEQLVLFLPTLWLCAFWAGDLYAGIAGILWVAFRILFAVLYTLRQNRFPGFGGALLCVIASLGAIIWHIIQAIVS